MFQNLSNVPWRILCSIKVDHSEYVPSIKNFGFTRLQVCKLSVLSRKSVHVPKGLSVRYKESVVHSACIISPKSNVLMVPLSWLVAIAWRDEVGENCDVKKGG